MAKRMAASELLSSKPQATHSEMDWPNHQKKKTEILTLRQFSQRVLKCLF